MKKLIALIAAMVMVTGYAYAADWDFYGSARVQTFILDYDISGNDDYAQSLQGNSRIGARVKVSDELSGRFEYGTSGGNANIRILYGEWNFGAGKFLVGQAYSPLNMFYSNQVYGQDTGLLGFGGVYSGRNAQLKLKFGGFNIALIEPNVSAGAEIEYPAIEASYNLQLGMFNLAAAGGYQTYDATGADSVDAYVVALGASADFGKFYMKGDIYQGQNAGELIWIATGGAAGDGKAVVAGTDVLDNDAFGYLLVAGFKLNDMFAFEGGWSSAETDLDRAADKDKVDAYYVQATIGLAPGVFLVPEIGVIDFKETGQDKINYYGIKWQINF